MLVPELRYRRDDGSEYPEWKEKKLVDMCLEILDGDWIESKDQSSEGVRLIQTGNIGVGVFVDKPDKYKFISEETFTRLHCKEIYSGDILISRLPSPAGRACIVPPMPYRMITAVDCSIVRTNTNNDSMFLLQCLCSEGYFNQIEAQLAGGTRQRISRKNLEQVVLRIPYLEEQQKIAIFMSYLDETISASEAEVATLELQKKGIMQKIFSQEVQFQRDDGTEFPEWEEVCLTDLMIHRDERQVPTSDAPLMAFIANQGVAPKGDRYDRSFLVKSEDKKYKRTEYNDFIYSSNNLDVGSIGLNKYGDAVISDVYEIFYFKDNADPDCMNLLIKQPTIMNKIIRFRQGCLYGQYRIYADDFLSIRLSVPCLEEQKKIAAFLSDIDETIDLAKQELEQWKLLKKGLMQKMFV